MEVVLPTSGIYIVAVSGGVDSRVLLDILVKNSSKTSHTFIVAHLNHGIRVDAQKDENFTKQLAEQYQLQYISKTISLGANASEEQARTARYAFLNDVQRSYHADAIITAHHQDDVLETAIMNILRGSGRKGLTSLQSKPELLRPFIDVPKSEIIKYAQTQSLDWVEDSTNTDDKYLRNYVRQNLISRLTDSERKKFLKIIQDLKSTNQELDELLIRELNSRGSDTEIELDWFNTLPHAVAQETMASWLRQNELRSFDKNTINRLVLAAKTARPGQTFPIYNRHMVRVGKDILALELAER